MRIRKLNLLTSKFLALCILGTSQLFAATSAPDSYTNKEGNKLVLLDGKYYLSESNVEYTGTVYKHWTTNVTLDGDDTQSSGNNHPVIRVGEGSTFTPTSLQLNFTSANLEHSPDYINLKNTSMIFIENTANPAPIVILPSTISLSINLPHAVENGIYTFRFLEHANDVKMNIDGSNQAITSELLANALKFDDPNWKLIEVINDTNLGFNDYYIKVQYVGSSYDGSDNIPEPTTATLSLLGLGTLLLRRRRA